MKMHHFTKSTTRGVSELPHDNIINMNGLMLDDFKKIHGGDFCALPDKWHPAKPGFRPYRLGDGTIVGVRDESA